VTVKDEPGTPQWFFPRFINQHARF